MDKSTADELVAAHLLYPHGAALRPRAERWGPDGKWRVVTTLGIYAEVPMIAALRSQHCRCRASGCASGRIAPRVLDRIRKGGKAHG